MTKEPVSLDDLLAARDALHADIVGKMPNEHRKFLISFEQGKPDWDLLGSHVARNLPAVKFRQQNLDKLPPEKRAALVAALRASSSRRLVDSRHTPPVR